MKKYILVSALAAGLLGLTACNDEFLDLSPKAAVTDATAFASYESTTRSEPPPGTSIPAC